jgi:CheY-like chemotaxis protein
MVVIRAVMKTMLHSLGFSPEFADHGGAAVEAVKAASYDIIFMDLQMPILDGIAATRAIREWERQNLPSRKPVKIVAVTSNVSEDDRRQCEEAGMDGFIGKPISLARLQAALGHFSP